MPTCNGCGAHVSTSSARVFEPQSGAGIDRCLECADGRAELAHVGG